MCRVFSLTHRYIASNNKCIIIYYYIQFILKIKIIYSMVSNNRIAPKSLYTIPDFFAKKKIYTLQYFIRKLFK